MNTHKSLTKEESHAFADLLHKSADRALTDQEQACLDELCAKDRNQLSAAQIEDMREAARQRAKLIDECGLTLDELSFHREILDRLARNDTSISPEEMRKFGNVCSDIERCLRGGGTPPGGASGTDDSGPDITDSLGAQSVEGDDEAKPTTALPVEEPVPVQIPVPVKPEDDKKKAKPRTPVLRKKGGVDFP